MAWNLIHNKGVIALSLDTWVSLGTLVIVALALWRYMDNKFDRMDAKFDKLEADFKGDIASLRQHVDNGFARVDSRLDVLEQRTYDNKST